MSIGNVVGRRVLVVEDEALITVFIEDVLKDMGCEIVGPTGQLETALRMASEETFDLAILDVTIRGGKTFPIAELLSTRGIPFMLSSGYGDWALPPAMRNQNRLMKPFTAAELKEQVRLLCG